LDQPAATRFSKKNKRKVGKTTEGDQKGREFYIKRLLGKIARTIAVGVGRTDGNKTQGKTKEKTTLLHQMGARGRTRRGSEEEKSKMTKKASQNDHTQTFLSISPSSGGSLRKKVGYRRKEIEMAKKLLSG